MTINAWKTSFIGINKPPKVLSGTALSFETNGLWPYPNSSNDPYWSNGSNPQYYRWIVTFSVDQRQHGSNLTRTPYSFNAQDIEVGDFVAGAQDGKVLQIMSVLSKSDDTLTAIVEDRLRYNTFRDPTGFGLFNTPGPVVFFQINELGFPMLDPVPGTAAGDFFTNVMSRFQYMNPLTNYLLEKTNHNFDQGDAICIEDGEFALSDPDNITKFIGTVVYPGPGPNQFILRPANGIIDFVPGLPGEVGDYLYPSLDSTGALTTNPDSRRPIYMKIADAIITETVGTNTGVTGVDNDQIEINSLPIDLYSGNGTYGLDEAIDLINAHTEEHKVTVEKVGGPTQVQSDTIVNTSAYGVIAGYTPFSISINGVTVNFTTTTSGTSAYGDPVVADASDMVLDINSAKIPGIIASLIDGVSIRIKNVIGGEIDIVNLTSDQNGNLFAGPNSISSLTEYTPQNTTSFTLRMYRLDGGPMTIRDVSGTFLNDIGVLSGQTGRYALGLNIEQGLRSSATTVVADMAARDALRSLVGDQCHVINDGNNEWALFVYDGSQWVKVSGERSASVDARTIIRYINLPGATQLCGTISENRRVLNVSVTVLETLMSPPDFTIDVDGITVWQYSNNGAKGVGTYTVDSSLITSRRSDVVINLPTVGAGLIRVEVTYI